MPETPHPDAWRGTVQQRLMIMAIVFALWSASVQGRLVWLQVHEHEHYVQKAKGQQSRTVVLPALRGSIVDRNGRVLATSADAATIFAVPTAIDNASTTARKLCNVLDGCTSAKGEYAGLVDRLSKKKDFAYVRRRVSPADAQKVRDLNLDGVGFNTESRRFYPNRELMASVLGYVGVDNKGLGGLEQKYDEIIRGQDGQALVLIDARRHAFQRQDRPPTAGASLELSLDASLQFVVERELAAGIAEHHAAGGVAIVMDPWTGEVLAMASAPTFNPNAYGDFDQEHRRNRGIADIYEPGSTFKIVTASAALEEKVLTPDTFIDCAPGHIDIGPRRVRDVHAYGSLSFTDVIVKSSNVGAIKTGFRVGSERMLRYVRRFGFGTRLSTDLPGEEPGIVWGQLNDGALASVSMGYQVGVTPLQMAAAVSSIANGGQLLRPRIVRAVVRGGVRHVVAPEVIRRTVTPETAATLTAIMEGVVDRGTGKTAQIDGYTIAGKTGTAAKLENGLYSKQKYMASIVGFLPSRKPAVTVLVVVDSPRAGGFYGGVVAGPVFRRIAEAAIRHMGLPRNINPEQPVVLARKATDAVTPVNFGLNTVLPTTGPAPGPDGVMPDLQGLSARSAVRVLARAGLAPHLAGRGVVIAQDPMAGTPLDSGASVRLRLDRELPPPPPLPLVDTAVQP